MWIDPFLPLANFVAKLIENLNQCSVNYSILLLCVLFQVDPGKYKGIFHGFKVTLREEGFRALGKGWAPTMYGYSMQGLGKFGLYEVFKIQYSNLMGEVRLEVENVLDFPGKKHNADIVFTCTDLWL